MDSSFLTSRLKKSFFRKSYTLKKKRLDEVVQMIELSNLDRQQLTEELAKLKQDLYATEQEKEKFKCQCQELEKQLNQTNISLQTEFQANSVLRTEYDNVSAKFNEFQTDCAMKLRAAAEKDHANEEKIQQLMATSENQILRDRFAYEKSQLEEVNQEIVKQMHAVQEAHTKTETRQKQAETEIVALKRELEKMRSGKLAIEAQLLNERKQNMKALEQSTVIQQELINEKSALEQQNVELVEKLYTLQYVHNENEERRMQMEAGFSTLKDEIEKLEFEKSAIENKFLKLEHVEDCESQSKNKDWSDHGDSTLENDYSV